MEKEAPLASRLRPTTLDEVVGQKHIIGKDKLLYRAIKADKLSSVIFYGPPGTGKTMFARYIAFKKALPFCYLNFSRIIDSYMGSTAKNIAKAFAYASSNPCIFMLDEVDTISCDRKSTSGKGSDGEMSRITVTLMQEFDKIPNDVIVLAATNRYDKYPYGKPQTDEVARGSGNREYGCRRLREKLPNFSGVSFFRAGNSSNRVNAFHICVYVHRCAVPRYIALQYP